jgi:RNase H-fold protein (predicted Holliday junction resolvase)
MFFRRAESEKQFILKGLDKRAEYQVRYHDENGKTSEAVFKGKELAETGLLVKLPEKRTSMLVEYIKK